VCIHALAQKLANATREKRAPTAKPKEKSMTEAEYQALCELVSTEIDQAVAVSYVYNALSDAIPVDELRGVLDRDGRFWRTQLHCLQTTLFITIARVFDTGEDAHSIHAVMRNAMANIEFFSPEALTARRMRMQNGVKPPWLDEFIARAWRPEKRVLGEIRTALAKQTNLFRDIYQPIRTQIFAHRLVDSETEWELFQKTHTSHIGEMLTLLRDTMDAIQEAFTNGTEPKLGQRSYGAYGQAFKDSAMNVLNRLAAREE